MESIKELEKGDIVMVKWQPGVEVDPVLRPAVVEKLEPRWGCVYAFVAIDNISFLVHKDAIVGHA